ncbi:hypothetical protein C8F01DRAFT_1377820 [Mycena amicta]|nr:hypothetical protein C8F01DRAFT_1377820 [Mycena amicta]
MGRGVNKKLFTIIGVLGSKDFPPVAWRDVQTQSPLKLSHSLVVYGCGTPQIQGVSAQPGFLTTGRWGLSLALNTRYFTPSRSIIPRGGQGAFGPWWIREERWDVFALRTSTIAWTTLCSTWSTPLEVRLLPLRDRGLTATRFEAINPAAFHTRDVVQASFAINIFRTLTDGEPRFTVKAVLRAIGRVDCQFAKDAYMASQKASSKHRAQPEGNADERKWKHVRLDR